MANLIMDSSPDLRVSELLRRARLCRGLTPDELAAIAHDAQLLGRHLAHSASGRKRMKAMIRDDIDLARAHGDYRDAAKLKLVLKHFIGLFPTELADQVAVAPAGDITDDRCDVFLQQEVDTADYLEWIWASGADALVEFIQARIDEGDVLGGWNDVGVKVASVAYNHRRRTLH
jgi:hypothetical protein